MNTNLHGLRMPRNLFDDGKSKLDILIRNFNLNQEDKTMITNKNGMVKIPLEDYQEMQDEIEELREKVKEQTIYIDRYPLWDIFMLLLVIFLIFLGLTEVFNHGN